MGKCTCNCRQQTGKRDASMDEKKLYICPQCHSFTATLSGGPPPECCGNKMQVMA
jgi:hypothetical protein